VLGNGDRLIPDLLLVGRDADRLKALSAANGDLRWTTSLDEALSGSDVIFIDCSATGGRPARVRKAIAAGKHIHIEKPTAPTVEAAMELARAAHSAGLKHGVIQDKLFSARVRQAPLRQERRLLWPHTLDPYRCWVLDFRWTDPGMPAAELEL
jgi:predicted dehydrogenase